MMIDCGLAPAQLELSWCDRDRHCPSARFEGGHRVIAIARATFIFRHYGGATSSPSLNATSLLTSWPCARTLGVVRLLLFDIDGTLVHTSGAGRRAIDAALRDLYGWNDPTAGLAFGGMTDPLIVREVFLRRGLAAEQVAEAMPRLVPIYLRHLERELEVGRAGCRALPGVRELVLALCGRQRECLVALLTGNVEGGARLKLAACDLWGPYFRFGAYGDDGARRVDLLPVALRRARALGVEPREVVIIGDTPADIEVARAHGAIAVAVATGASSKDELARHAPDALVDDLADLQAAMRLLLG
jgi:phosphoglycolate phosphatase